MPDIYVKIRNRIAETIGSPTIICGNSDYAYHFDFDAEWGEYAVKTVRWAWKDKTTGQQQYHEAELRNGAAVLQAPAIYNTNMLLVGMYAGNIRATTPTLVMCTGGIRDPQPYHNDPDAATYEQLLAYLERLAGGGNMPDVAVFISNGVQFNAVPEVIEEPTPVN